MQAKQDQCSQPGLMHPEQAIPMILEQVQGITDTELVPLVEALDRVLAEDLASPIDLPPFNNSSMDGYAFRFADLQQNRTLKQIGTSFAGHPYEGEYQTNSCIRIMTGAAVPNCYDTVQMQEKVSVNGDNISIELPDNQGASVRLQGSEIQACDSVLKIGTKITASVMGVLATIGVSQVRVYRKLTVAFFSTGDELRPVGAELALGQIYDSNRYSIMGLLEKSGVEWLDLGVIPDDPEAIRQAFRNAASTADLVLTSGGVSVGDADYTKQILDEEGRITFWKMAIKPGKPFAFGKLGKALFCGLPGNPVSTMVVFYKVVQPILEKMQNLPYSQPLKLKAKLTQDIKKAPGRVDYQRGILTYTNTGELEVCSTGHQGSGMMTSMTQANCFIIIEQMQGDVSAGTQVDVEPFNAVLS